MPTGADPLGEPTRSPRGTKFSSHPSPSQGDPVGGSTYGGGQDGAPIAKFA